MDNKIKNNARIVGKVVSEINFNHVANKKKFFRFYVSAKRFSGVEDIIPVIVDETLMDSLNLTPFKNINVEGIWSSWMRTGHLDQYLLAAKIEILSETEETYVNSVFLDGHLCKTPVCRTTPLGRHIADLLIAVNYPSGKSDYLPCICWGKNTEKAKLLTTGSHLCIKGRMQSRTYVKKYEDGTNEIKTAYEVSVCEMEVVEEEAGITQDDKEI